MAKETENLDLDVETLQKGVSTVLEGKTAAAYYVVEEANQVVGSLMLTYEWSDWRCSNIWWIQSVYVLPSARRRGNFKRLYAHVKEEAKAAQASGLRLYADTGNTAAHATYEKLGMTSHYKVFEDMFTSY
ncbi:acyl-CoA N-acyltransferase [Dunaliella salina]|uniref:Acyl-CoA N-acyltransferase n=1 Tax=Dunaliella salina TaxID=3046 RepID=A0ABQ7GMM4_DUNSA|nr:acyl-CoA N-acyltransferase [Dunaliella salina]|eukprot:KAF5835862.1 acyl-CoA N-acyltransferase [Dunaliella salina]